jgi:dTDP-glucose 4,6-dehydratase
MRILVAGGAGFIGSNFIRHMLSTNKDIKIINYDKLTYAGNLDNLKDIEKDPRYTFVKGDITDEGKLEKVVKKVEYIVNFAAETHVDRSIHLGARQFVMTNTVGVQSILDAARKHGSKKYVQISTDEVYGSLSLDDSKKFVESTPFEPNVPYAAAKAGGDMICRAYFHTYGTPVIVTHCSNNYGPFQYPEKLIPFFTLRALSNMTLPLYGDGKNIRDWIWVLDHCKAIELLLRDGTPGEVYNIGADNERDNIEISKLILEILDKPESMIAFVKDRPGHDRRYAIDASKLRKELGWKPEYGRSNFKEALTKTVNWYVDSKEWVENIKKKVIKFNPHIKF